MVEFTAEELITTIRNTDEYIPLIYMHGGCWEFHKLLRQVYPNAEPYMVCCNVPEQYDHVITKIESQYYDISGIVKPRDYFGIKKVYTRDLQILEKWSFSKNNLLFSRCPHCLEEICFDKNGKVAL